MLAHNLVLLAALVTNGAFALALLRGLGLGRLAAVGGGALLCLLPYVHHELGVLTLVPLAGVLATLHALLALSQRPTAWRGVRLGLCFGAAYLLCGQYALFLTLVALPAAACLVRRVHLAPRGGLALLLAVGSAGALVTPVARAQLELRREHGFVRSLQAGLLGAAEPADFLLATRAPLLPLPGVRTAPDPSQRALYPGTLTLALACAGLAFGLRRAGQRRFCAFLALTAAGGALMAQLPHLEAFGVPPYAWLRDRVVGLAQIRSLWRAAVLMQVSTALLAAVGLEALAAAVRRAGAARRAATAGLLGLLIAAALEVWPLAPALSRAPSREAWRPWLDWIAQRVPPGTPLAHLPVPASASVVDYEETARAMLLATAHGHPLVNGYSSYFPRPYRAFERILRRCPSPAAWDLLRRLPLPFLVVRSSWAETLGACAPDASLYRPSVRFESLDVEIWEAVVATPDRGGTRGGS